MKRVDSTFVVIANKKKDKVLLVNSNGSWGFPGGMREVGESLKQAGAREVLEEVGLSVDLGPLNSVTEVLGKEVHDLFATFLVILDEEKVLDLTGDKAISAIRWASVEEATELMPWYPGGVRALLTSEAVYSAS